MGYEAWLRAASLFYVLICSVLSTNVTITSSPQLGVDAVCDNQDVTLMCHTDQTTGNLITWYWSNQSQHGDTVTVVARMTRVVYTCAASGKEEHKASVTVVANGTPPAVKRYNFNPYILKYEGSNLTLVTEITSDLPLSSGDIKWVGFHRPLPSTAVVDNYTTDGVLYSRLSLYELSFEDDSGNYTNIVSIQCGTSSVSVYIDVRKAPIVCKNPGILVSPQRNLMTVKGESIMLSCQFRGNLKTLDASLTSYWSITPYGQTSNKTFIMDNSTYPYLIGVYQNEDCNFTNQLTIQSVPMYHVNLTCVESLDGNRYSHTSELTVFDLPKVTDGPKKHIKTKLNDSISLQCQFRAPIGVTIVVWLKDNLPVKNTQHYNIITTTNPGVDDLIVSNLNINTITSEDEGTYTCYCYYNRTMVTSSKNVISNKVSTTLHLRQGGHNTVGWKKHIGYFLAVAGILALVILFVLCCVYRQCRHHDDRKGIIINDNSESSDDDDDDDDDIDHSLFDPVQIDDTHSPVEVSSDFERSSSSVIQVTSVTVVVAAEVLPPGYDSSPLPRRVTSGMGTERLIIHEGRVQQSVSMVDN